MPERMSEKEFQGFRERFHDDEAHTYIGDLDPLLEECRRAREAELSEISISETYRLRAIEREKRHEAELAEKEDEFDRILLIASDPRRQLVRCHDTRCLHVRADHGEPTCLDAGRECSERNICSCVEFQEVPEPALEAGP